MLLFFACADPPPAVSPASYADTLAQLPALAAQPGPLQASAAALHALQPTSLAVQTAEVAVLRAAVERALSADDLFQAARLLALTRSPDPAFFTLAETVLDRLQQATPAVRAEALPLLAEALPDRADTLRIEAADAALRVALLDPAALRARAAGITYVATVALLTRLDTAYIADPPWALLVTAAARRLGVLARCPEGLALWPGLAAHDFSLDTPKGTMKLSDAVAALDAALLAARQAGLPDELLLLIWTDAALAALDPWTRPVWPAEIASWEAENAGVKVGVGLELRLRPLPGRDAAGRQLLSDTVEVLKILPDTPAWSSGIRQGDALLAVAAPNCTRTTACAIRLAELPRDTRLAAAEAALTGEEGSSVQLFLERAGAEQTHTLTRAPVVTETVEGFARRPDNTWEILYDPADSLAYVRITRFRPTTEAAFDQLVAGALVSDTSLRGMILDLRGNPGGDVNAAVQIADRFVAEGRLTQVTGRVLPPSTEERDPTTGELLPDWNEAIPGHDLEGLPLVVLVDEATASAAEVLAAALQELGPAPVVGAPTWGKGRAQHIYSDPSGTWALQYTNFAWASPSGRQLVHGVGGGITPDLVLPLSTAEGYQARRLQSQRAALRVHADGAPMVWPDPGLNPEIPSLPDDPQRLAADLLLRDLLRRAALAAPSPP